MTRFLFLLLLSGCGSDYTAPSLDACEAAGGILVRPYKSPAICIRREAVIDARDIHDRR